MPILNILLFLIVGVIIGAAVLFAAFNSKLIPGLPGKNTSPSPIAQAPQGSPVVVTQNQLDQLRKQLYQEGVTVSVRADKVYGNTGFIMADDTGTRMFVRWSGTPPKEGQQVSVKGVIKKMSTDFVSSIKGESGYNSDLDNFLKDQQIYIEASQITS